MHVWACCADLRDHIENTLSVSIDNRVITITTHTNPADEQAIASCMRVIGVPQGPAQTRVRVLRRHGCKDIVTGTDHTVIELQRLTQIKLRCCSAA